MQFHLNGYSPGDPRVLAADPSVVGRGSGLPETVDVLIVGAGPAGLVLAAQLVRFPEIRSLVVDRRDGPLALGQADGVACRTVEMFEAFGLASQLLEESYWVNEVCFWRPDPDDKTGIKRTGRVVDTEEGLSEFPHVIVNQARMLAFLLEHMQRSPSRSTPLYGLQVTEVDVQRPRLVTVTLVHTDTGESSTIQARYVVGCDGSRSRVRTAVGRELVGDVTDERWGVMDVLCVTDFPDIRVKSAITSAHGNVLIIPREGGHLVRFYVELDRTGDRASVTPEKLADAARTSAGSWRPSCGERPAPRSSTHIPTNVRRWPRSSSTSTASSRSCSARGRTVSVRRSSSTISSGRAASPRASRPGTPRR